MEEIKLPEGVPLWDIERLRPYEKNARTHTQQQVEQIAASMVEFGFTNPILVDEADGIIAGHGRLMAANHLGMHRVPVVHLTHLTPAQKRAYIIADNQLALNAGWDAEILEAELRSLGNDGFDLSVIGFTDDELAAMLPKEDGTGSGSNGLVNHGALIAAFGVPPFSVLDTRQGYWQERKADWLQRVGNLSATKEMVLTGGRESLVSSINEGSSNFDPVLAELMYRWFNVPGGRILDPFGGEQTKGVVAGELGYKYQAVEFRQDQVDVNRKAVAGYRGVEYACGDSNNISKLITDREFDFVFTSPPYYDLEVYSKDDMSALGTYEGFMAQYENIFSQCVDMLGNNRFLAVKVGEIRDKKGGQYRNFVGDNIAMFMRLGLHYYNDIVLVAPAGTAQLRANKSMINRKVVKLHQNVLVFFKGDLKQIKNIFPAMHFSEAKDGPEDEHMDK